MIVPDIYLNMVLIVPEIYLRHSGNSTMPRQPDLLLIWMAPHWVQLQLQPIGSLPSISLSKCSTWNIRHNYKVNLFFLLCLFRLPPPPPYHYHHHSHHQLWHYRHLWHYHYHHHYHHLWHHHQQHNLIFTTRWTSCFGCFTFLLLLITIITSSATKYAQQGGPRALPPVVLNVDPESRQEAVSALDPVGAWSWSWWGWAGWWGWGMDKMIMMSMMMTCRQEGASPLDMHGVSHHCSKSMMIT